MASVNLNFKIVTVLPGTRSPYTVYMVYNPSSPTQAKFCVTDATGVVAVDTVSKSEVADAIGAIAATTWSNISGKPAVIAAGADAAEARFAIGAGTSNLALGTTDATAAKGDHTHAVATTSADGLMSAADKAKLDVAGGLKSVDASAAVFQATASDRIWVKYTAGPAVIKLPMTPVYGDVIEINKINGVTVTSLDLNGATFQNTVTDGVILDFDNLCLGIAYSGSDFGWKVIYGI